MSRDGRLHTLGSGAVQYHPDRPIVHFGTPPRPRAEDLVAEQADPPPRPMDAAAVLAAITEVLNRVGR